MFGIGALAASAIPNLTGGGGVSSPIDAMGGLMGGQPASSSATGGTGSIKGDDVFNIGSGGGVLSSVMRRSPWAGVAMIGVAIGGVLLLVKLWKG